MKGEIIGHITCPLDGKEALVKLDKNGHAYGFCPDCTMQLLTHGGQKEKLLRAVMRPIAGPAPEPKPRDPVPTPAPAPKPTPKPAPKAGFFSPILGRDHE